LAEAFVAALEGLLGLDEFAFALQLHERALHHAGDEIEKGNVLDEEVHGPLLHHVDGDLRISQPTDDDEGHAGLAETQRGGDLPPVRVRQLEV
jgi:hypothetical protein